MKRLLAEISAIFLILLVLCDVQGAQQQVKCHYIVDPTWPQRPPEIEWGETPGVAVDAKDQVWVSTRSKNPVQLYDSHGKFVRSWGGDLISIVHYIQLDPEGNVWVADVGKHVILEFAPEGKLLRTLGTPDQPGCDEMHFNMPTDMVITPTGDVFVADGYQNQRIVHFDKNGKFISAWGMCNTGAGLTKIRHAIVADSQGRLYTADRSDARIAVFDQQGRLLGQWTNVIIPWGLWMTDKDELWVCGSSPRRPEHELCPYVPPVDQVFIKFDTSGKVLKQWTVPLGKDGQEKPGELNWVHGIAVDSKGNVYASDIKGHRVQKFIPQN